MVVRMSILGSELDRLEEIVRGTVQQRFLNIVQASKYSGLSQKSIRRMIDAGKLKAHKPNKRVLIDRLALDSMIQAS